jgi:hypothetical protein
MVNSVRFDEYVLESLMADLMGHDRMPLAACHPEPAQRGEGPVSSQRNGSFAALRASGAPPAQDDRW